MAAPDFDIIAKRIAAEMRIVSFDVCRGEREEVKGCKRPEFVLEVSDELFDLFYNSSHGYRAQYHSSPEEGESANARVISMMLKKLTEYANDQTTNHIMQVDSMSYSLGGSSSKIWIDEEGSRAQQPDDLKQLKIDLAVEPWLNTAKMYVAAPAEFLDPNKEIKAVDGVKAPVGTRLEVKGAFVDDDGQERIPGDKRDRSLQIHLYGYT